MKPINELRIAFAADHAGFELKQMLVNELAEKGATIKDFGAFSTESFDYPDSAHPLAIAVERGDFEFGIAVCGSGNGINMTVNKYQGIRSALCWVPELATMARLHNDANVLALPARFISVETAKEIVAAFFSTDFEGGRHLRRIKKIPC